MKYRVVFSILAALGVLPFAACSKSSVSPSVSFTAPIANTPAGNTSYRYSQQPITLTLTNAQRATSAAATYSVEVSTDSGFGNKVFTKDGIQEGSGGTTSIQLSTLPGNTTYYWRSKATIEGTTGNPSPALQFYIQPQVVIGVPGVANPANGGTASDARPTFTVVNSSHSGPVDRVYYEFQVSSSSSFSSILVSSGPVAENPSGQTSWTSTVDIAQGTYYWRARGTDPVSTEVSAYTGATQFQLVPFDMRNALIWDNPQDLGSWAETANITRVDLSGGRIVVDFDKRDCGGHPCWPDVGFGDGSINYTLGICMKINGTWNCSAVVQFWYGRDLDAGGDVGNLAGEWFYDHRWGNMMGYQPAYGETVGWFVAAGNLRDSGNVIAKERSRVLMLPYGQNYQK